MRFEVYGWHVIPKVDGHDAEAVKAAIEEARGSKGQTPLICCQTLIGYGSPNKQGKEECHGAPPLVVTRSRSPGRRWGGITPRLTYRQMFTQDGTQRSAAQTRKPSGKHRWPPMPRSTQNWLWVQATHGRRDAAHQENATAFIEAVNKKGEKLATRKASQNAIEGYGPFIPEYMGGSADLAGSI